MKIIVDIGHPAHVHYFKNCARILEGKGHTFLFVVRERDSTIELIKSTGFDYVSRGKGGQGILQKTLMIPRIDKIFFSIAKKFKPDLFLSFSSAYAAHVSTIMRKPHIALDDTEHAKFEHWMSRPFSDVLLSPSCYSGKLWKNQLLFDSFIELCYLHPNYFQPDKSVLQRIGLKTDEKYCILRFVSWDSNHDVGQRGLTYKDKIELVDSLKDVCRVFISSEGKSGDSFNKYRLDIHPSDLHHAIAYSNLYIGEGGTTASEAVVLGVPAIYTSSLKAGIFDEEENRGMLFQLRKIDEIKTCAIKLLKGDNIKDEFLKKREKLLNDKIDPTAFLVWFIENYPDSKRIMKDNPDYQYNFK